MRQPPQVSSESVEISASVDNSAPINFDPRGKQPATTRSTPLNWLIEWTFPIIVAALATGWFWRPVVEGRGFVGGDVYNYFMPLKSHYAEGLKRGEISAWHERIGHGVPVVGEGQTGPYYPPNLVAYRALDVHSAYHLLFLVHYLVAYLGTYRLARTQLGVSAAHVVATTFVFGWFPARSCLEWAVTTGCWFCWILYAQRRWLDTGRRRWWLLIAMFTAMQLLAGHFQLAFVTMLGEAIVLAVRLIASLVGRSIEGSIRVASALVAIVVGASLAAPQLAATFELKKISQRETLEFRRTVAYGNVPRWYFSAWIFPYDVYPRAAEFIQQLGGGTNIVEAHLYLGVVAQTSLAIVAGAGLLRLFARRRLKSEGEATSFSSGRSSDVLISVIMIVAGLVLAEGSALVFLSDAPGFSFFRYPGRYGLMTQLGGAMIAASVVERIARRRAAMGFVVAAIAIVVSLIDFEYVAGPQTSDVDSNTLWPPHRRVQYVDLVKPPIYGLIDQSIVLPMLSPTDRVLAVDGNTLALGPASCVRPYVGLEPTVYQTVWDRTPDLFHGAKLKPAERDAAVAILRRTGVTKLLVEEPLPDDFPAERLWSGVDPFLHRRWGRSLDQPLFLYSLGSALGRVSLEPSRDDELRGDPPVGSCEIVESSPDRVVIDVDLDRSGELTLRDLDYPGWSATIEPIFETNGLSSIRTKLRRAETEHPLGDGSLEEAIRKLERRVAVPAGRSRVTWRYRPVAFSQGLWVAVAGSATMIAVALFSRRRT